MHPVETMDPTKIRKMVLVCIMLHNMMVQERLDHGLLDEDDFAMDDEALFGDQSDDDDSNSEDRAQEEVEIMEAEVRRRLEIIRLYQENDVPFVDSAAQSAQDRIDRLPQAMRVVQHRWESLYDKEKHQRLQNAIVEQLATGQT